MENVSEIRLETEKIKPIEDSSVREDIKNWSHAIQLLCHDTDFVLKNRYVALFTHSIYLDTRTIEKTVEDFDVFQARDNMDGWKGLIVNNARNIYYSMYELNQYNSDYVITLLFAEIAKLCDKIVSLLGCKLKV